MKDRRIGTEGVKCEHTCRGSWAENGLIVMRGALPLKFTGEGFQQRVLNGFINMPLYADYNDFGTQLSLGAPRAFLLTCSAAYWIINMLYMFIRDRYRARTDNKSVMFVRAIDKQDCHLSGRTKSVTACAKWGQGPLTVHIQGKVNTSNWKESVKTHKVRTVESKKPAAVPGKVNTSNWKESVKTHKVRTVESKKTAAIPVRSIVSSQAGEEPLSKKTAAIPVRPLSVRRQGKVNTSNWKESVKTHKVRTVESKKPAAVPGKVNTSNWKESVKTHKVRTVESKKPAAIPVRSIVSSQAGEGKYIKLEGKCEDSQSPLSVRRQGKVNTSNWKESVKTHKVRTVESKKNSSNSSKAHCQFAGRGR
ncbi:hypothetical protein J6590_037699 [Homalodisca vitripennis]|nr:hypothetical protein J6590_037699 [Homalodisca vitripennis]